MKNYQEEELVVKNGKIELVSLKGIILHELDMQNENLLDMSLYPSGIYLIRFKHQKGTAVKKILKL